MRATEESAGLSWDDGYAAGCAAARATVEAEFAADRMAIAMLAASLADLAPPDPAVLADAIAVAALQIARAAAGSAVDAELLAARAHQCVMALTDSAGTVCLRVSPGDLALLDIDQFDVRLIADPDLPRGSIRAEADHAWAADGVAEALDAIGWQP